LTKQYGCFGERRAGAEMKLQSAAYVISLYLKYFVNEITS